MNKRKTVRLLAFLLAALMALGAFSLSSFATGDSTATTPESSYGRTEEEIKTLLDTISYTEYLKRYAGVASAQTGVTISAADSLITDDAELTDATYKVWSEYGGKTGSFLEVGEEGTVTFKVTVPQTGMYSIRLAYYPIGQRATSIERMLYIDGKVPFAEARYLTMTKAWKDVFTGEEGVFKTDAAGNEVRPDKVLAPEWRTYDLCDSTGYYVDAFSFYFEAGEHTIALESVRESIVLDTIQLNPVVKYPTYQEYLEANAGKPDVQNAVLTLQAELSSVTSEQILYPLSDRTSAITTPQHPSQTRLNTIGSTKWQTVGQWIRYDNITVSESGFYQIAVRYKQDQLSGMFASRRIRINGEIPFEEASYLQFKYDDNWQSTKLTDGTTEFKFYLEAGKTYSIEFEVVLGHMAEILRQVSEILDSLNADYLKIMMITGASPDEYRTYGFFKLMPEVIEDLRARAKELREISEKFYQVTGTKGSSVATLDKVANVVERMSSRESQVAKNLDSFKTYLGTLGTWLYSAQLQSLELDCIQIQGVAAEIPEADAGFFASAWFELRQFAASFVTDYNAVSATTDTDDANATSVEIWYTGGRDRAQILRQLVDNEFTPNTKALYGHTINVELKLVAGGLLQSVLAGIGPDVSFLTSADTVNWALRGALEPLNGFDGFEEMTTGDDAWFAEAALVPLRLDMEDGQGKLTYGLPNTMDFMMMFYRLDILAELGLGVPKTWDEFYDMLPILQVNNMQVAFPSQLAGLNLLTYQMGGSQFADGDENGKEINFEDNTTLTAWETLLDMFEQYRFPLAYDFPTRFRSGEMPIGIISYQTYNQLVLYASELRGLWEFTPLPGYDDGTGKINNCANVTVDAIVMPTGVEEEIKEDAWRLMQWYTSATTQARYANELQAVLGSGAKYNTANIQAISELPWTASEYRALAAQMQNLNGIPEYPGSYIITRYVQFAFYDVYNQDSESTGENAAEALMDYIMQINKELNRKRKEFGLEYIDYSQS